MQTVQKTGEIPQVLFWDMVVMPVVVQQKVLGLRHTVNCGISAVTVLGQALTMSSWSLVVAKMQVKVSIGSFAILGEIIEMSWVMSVWRLALSMLRVSVRGLPCRVTLRLRTCPLLYSTAEARGNSTGAVLGPLLRCRSWPCQCHRS